MRLNSICKSDQTSAGNQITFTKVEQISRTVPVLSKYNLYDLYAPDS